MKTIILDTNVYGWYLSYTLESDRKHEAVNSFTLLSKLLENKGKIEVLATETIEKLFSVTLADCGIVAAATLAGVKLLITENRKTLNTSTIKEAFRRMGEIYV